MHGLDGLVGLQVARTVGWISQWKEMMEEASGRISRPRQVLLSVWSPGPCQIGPCGAQAVHWELAWQLAS